MTLRDFLTSRGYLTNPQATKSRCPFHNDRSPSAMIHDDSNTLWCFSCSKNYGPVDFYNSFGVVLDTIAQPLVRVHPLAYEWGEPLFYS